MNDWTGSLLNLSSNYGKVRLYFLEELKESASSSQSSASSGVGFWRKAFGETVLHVCTAGNCFLIVPLFQLSLFEVFTRAVVSLYPEFGDRQMRA